jgi:8-oxo-dGTP pyrophosphatase MutT (NUDIX family)
MPKFFRRTVGTEFIMKQKLSLAASIVLLRPAQPRGFEVFLRRRSDAMLFLGGTYCFPGGALRREDYSDAMLKRSAGLTAEQAQKIIGAEVAPRQALGLWIAALRELFEEVGILIAINEARERLIIESCARTRLAKMQAALLANSLTFEYCLQTENLFCDLAALLHFSHWQTPPEESMRFDTHFFLAALPPNRLPLAASAEVAHGLWATPDQALQMFGKNELPVIFPTFASLRTLADFETLDSVLGAYRTGR